MTPADFSCLFIFELGFMITRIFFSSNYSPNYEKDLTDAIITVDKSRYLSELGLHP